ncbi:MAG: hypothetical protein JWP98_121 [Edaphobacter sp.]|nr:hypothetical protein [Edaphobacter sp.]
MTAETNNGNSNDNCNSKDTGDGNGNSDDNAAAEYPDYRVEVLLRPELHLKRLLLIQLTYFGKRDFTRCIAGAVYVYLHFFWLS